MTRRLAVRWLLVCSATGVALVLRSVPASAQAPDEQGWWTAANPGGLPTSPSSASDVPADGLLVQGGPRSPTAYSALSYSLADGAGADKLTLKVAPGSATTPSATLRLCPLTSDSFTPEQGGPSSDAPAYDCRKNVSGKPDPSGSRFTFHVASLVSDAALNVAILPGDSTSRVVLSKPDSSSLHTTPGARASSSTVDRTGSAAATGPGAATKRTPPSTPALPSRPTVTDPTSGQTPTVASSPSAAFAPGNAAPVAATPLAVTAAGGSVLPRVVGGLLFAAVVVAVLLWAFAGGRRHDAWQARS